MAPKQMSTLDRWMDALTKKKKPGSHHLNPSSDNLVSRRLSVVNAVFDLVLVLDSATPMAGRIRSQRTVRSLRPMQLMYALVTAESPEDWSCKVFKTDVTSAVFPVPGEPEMYRLVCVVAPSSVG